MTLKNHLLNSAQWPNPENRKWRHNYMQWPRDVRFGSPVLLRGIPTYTSTTKNDVIMLNTWMVGDLCFSTGALFKPKQNRSFWTGKVRFFFLFVFSFDLTNKCQHKIGKTGSNLFSLEAHFKSLSLHFPLPNLGFFYHLLHTLTKITIFFPDPVANNS